MFRGAIIVLFSSVSVKYLISLSNLSSKHSMLATLPHLHRHIGSIGHGWDNLPGPAEQQQQKHTVGVTHPLRRTCSSNWAPTIQ